MAQEERAKAGGETKSVLLIILLVSIRKNYEKNARAHTIGMKGQDPTARLIPPFLVVPCC